MKLSKFILVITACGLLTLSANAEHRWSTYHWATTDGIAHLPAVDQVTSDWQGSYEESLNRWEASAHIDHAIREQGDESNGARKRCRSIQGKMVTCNSNYGFNGWAGLASINIDSNSHITRGVAKMNDSYLSDDPIDFRNHVMCQEIGHVYGLGHTSEDGSSQGTCMDYSNSLTSQWPNRHDLEELATIYNHSDSYTSTAALAGASTAACNGDSENCGSRSRAVPEFGIKVSQTARSQIWVSAGENGSIWVHHITLAEGYTDIVHDAH